VGHAERTENIDGNVPFNPGAIVQIIVKVNAGVVDEEVETIMAGDPPGRWLLQLVRADLSLIICGPYEVAVVLGRGKLAKIEVALSSREEFQVEPRGEWLRKDGACRGLDIRAATFVSPFSEFEMKDWMLQRIE
jgi:hypothetical protein